MLKTDTYNQKIHTNLMEAKTPLRKHEPNLD